MISVSTWAQSKAIAPEARKERADISAGLNPKRGPIAVQAIRRTSVISAGLMGWKACCCVR
jgi:hypothetical protein